LKNKKEIEFITEDTRIDIEQEKLSFIFDQFKQVKPSKSDIFGGTGLSLAITKSCIELLGGKVNVESNFGKGSKFTVTIPYKPYNQIKT